MARGAATLGAVCLGLLLSSALVDARYLTLTTLWANSADDNQCICLVFRRKNALTFHANSKETIYSKFQSLFSGKIKKNISKYRLMKSFTRMLFEVKKQNV